MTSENIQIAQPLRGAVVGFGGVAVNAHLPVWREDRRFRIDAVVEPFAERARLVERLLPEARIFPNMASLAAAGCVDFVDICTPPGSHEDLMLKACGAGLHVFCEKPLPPVSDGFMQLRAAAAASKSVLFVVNNWKYAPIWAKTLEIVKSGQIGKIKSISLSVRRTPGSGGGISDWRQSSRIAGGGILLDHGWHNLYLVMAAMDECPTGVSARMAFGGADGSGMEEIVDLVLRFSNAEARLHLTRRAEDRRNEGLIIGDRGALEINDDHLLVNIGAGAPVRCDFTEPLSAGSHHPEWMKVVVEDFYREVQQPETRGANFAEALWCAHLTDLAYRSCGRDGCLMETGRPLDKQTDHPTGGI